MRLASLAVPVLVLALAVPAGLAATRGAGTFAIEDGVGYVTIRGSGTLVGRLDRGDLLIVDLTPLDQWSPRVNGVPRGRVVGMRGRSVNFFVPGGKYRIELRGDGIALSARGTGVARLRARPGAAVDPGMFAKGDDDPTPLPADLETIAFGTASDAKGTTP